MEREVPAGHVVGFYPAQPAAFAPPPAIVNGVQEGSGSSNSEMSSSDESSSEMDNEPGPPTTEEQIEAWNQNRRYTNRKAPPNRGLKAMVAANHRQDDDDRPVFIKEDVDAPRALRKKRGILSALMTKPEDAPDARGKIGEACSFVLKEWQRRRRRENVTKYEDMLRNVDLDLTYELKFESMFLKRTELLAITLKNKAKQFMAKFDRSQITRQQEYRITGTAIMAAMAVDEMEVAMGDLMRSQQQKLAMQAMNFPKSAQ